MTVGPAKAGYQSNSWQTLSLTSNTGLVALWQEEENNPGDEASRFPGQRTLNMDR